MDIKKYEALLYSIDHGTFSAAAQIMGYTPAGISHMVDAVEQEFGFPLLKRGHGGVTLNEHSRELVDEIRQIVRHESILRQRASEITGLATGTVTVGAYYSIATHWLPNVFMRFWKLYPGVNIVLREGGHQYLSRWMDEGRIDFCLYSHEKESGYVWLPIGNDMMTVVVPEGHELASKSAVDFSDCEKYPFIMPALGQEYDINQLLKHHPMKLDIRFSTIENYSALAMVESGLGISIMNELITKGLTRRIVCLPFEKPQYISLGIAMPSMQYISPAAKRLAEFIVRELSVI